MKTNKPILLAFSALLFLSAHAQSLKVEQIKDSTYSIDVNASSIKSKLLWNTKPDSWTSAQPLILKSSHETIRLASAHPIVKLDVARERPVYTAPRAVILQGAVNFRDMGGYITKDNREVKWGKIYRSADISKLTDQDLKTILALNIKMVCDFRGPAEISAAPDRIPEGVDRINLPAGSENIGGANSFMKYMKSPALADSMMRSVYVKNDFFKAKYKPMFDQLLSLEDDKALMFHCTAGKDRTGIGAALILYALGVPEAEIFKDYELTNEYRKQSNEERIKMMTAQGISEQAARSMMAADPRYLKACFDSLNEKYGSIDKFLETEMELTPKKREELKNKLLY
jgi:protein-tyrosine phosphatase